MVKPLFKCAGCEVVTKKVVTCDCCSTYSCESCMYGKIYCGNHDQICADCYPCCIKCATCETMKNYSTSVMCNGKCLKYVCIECQGLYKNDDYKMVCGGCFYEEIIFS